MLSKVTHLVHHTQGLESRSPSTKSLLFASYRLDLPPGHFPPWTPELGLYLNSRAQSRGTVGVQGEPLLLSCRPISHRPQGDRSNNL